MKCAMDYFGECPWNDTSPQNVKLDNGSQDYELFGWGCKGLCMSYCQPHKVAWLVLLCRWECASPRSKGGDSMGDNAAACIPLFHLGYTWLPSVHAQWHPLFPLLDWLICRGSGFVCLKKKKRKKKVLHTTGSGFWLLLYLWRQHVQLVCEHPDFLSSSYGVTLCMSLLSKYSVAIGKFCSVSDM